MHINKGGSSGDRNPGESSFSGTLMIALFVVAATIVVYALVSINAPQNLARTSMGILAPSLATLVVTSVVGDSIPINNINIIVGPDTYHGSGIEDKDHNGRWDPGEHAPYKMIDSTYLTMGYHRLEIGYENYDGHSALIGDLHVRKQPGGAWEQPGLYYLEGVTT